MTSPDSPIFSFLLPTRDRVKDLTALLESIQATTRHPERLEIVLGIDEDDLATKDLEWPALVVKKTILPKGLTMGAMNNACYAASSGRYVMLMNDDMLLHTDGWDEHPRAHRRRDLPGPRQRPAVRREALLLPHAEPDLLRTGRRGLPHLLRTLPHRRPHLQRLQPARPGRPSPDLLLPGRGLRAPELRGHRGPGQGVPLPQADPGPGRPALRRHLPRAQGPGRGPGRPHRGGPGEGTARAGSPPAPPEPAR